MIQNSLIVSHLGVALMAVSLPSSLRADPAYRAASGKVSFSVGSNIPYLTVSGSSSAVRGGGEASVAGNSATVRNLVFDSRPQNVQNRHGAPRQTFD